MSGALVVRRFGPIEVEVRTGVVFVRPITALDAGGLNRPLSFRSREEVAEALQQHKSRRAGRLKPNADYVAALGFILKEHLDVF